MTRIIEVRHKTFILWVDYKDDALIEQIRKIVPPQYREYFPISDTWEIDKNYQAKIQALGVK